MLPDKIAPRTVGKTVILVVGEDTYKANLEKDEKEKLKTKVANYNNKPSDYWLKQIISTFKRNATPISKEKIDTKVAKKKVKEVKASNKEDKERVKRLEETVATLQQQLDKANKIIADSNTDKANLVEGIKQSSERIGKVADSITPKAVAGESVGGEH